MKFRILPRLVFFACVSMLPGNVMGQNESAESLPSEKLLLNDLSAFSSTGANWKIVGNVFADMRTDQVLTTQPGKGILANMSDEKNRAHLFTRMEHGDIELEMDVMMAKGSNSGIYLQGRYEVQLFDSWGKPDKKYSHMGGIYQRTDSATNKGFEGSAPLVNACKAPGLWQRLKIIFKAPEFDASGKKISDARFVKVYLNGMIVQEDVAVSGPTRSAAFNDEKPLGPVMIQGNHGKVAFRNIRFKLNDRKTVALKELTYREYKTPGEFMRNTTLLEKMVERKVDSISRHNAGQPDIFLMQYSGFLEFPKSGPYVFTLQSGGGGALIIKGDTIIRHDGANSFDEKAVGKYQARAGRIPFVLVYNKPIQYREGLALYAEGPRMATHPLHAKGSVFREPPVEPLLIPVDSGRALIQRSFMNDQNGKRTHCVSVSTPRGIHFTVDLSTGNLFQVWDGGFLDATPMWHRRGNQQVGMPLGPRIVFPDGTGIIKSSAGTSKLLFTEYILDAAGLPEFHYRCGGITIIDKFTPTSGERSITRKVTIDGAGDFDYVLGQGASVERAADGSFIVNDKEYYLVTGAGMLQPQVENSGPSKRVVIHAKSKGHYEFEYKLLW